MEKGYAPEKGCKLIQFENKYKQEFIKIYISRSKFRRFFICESEIHGLYAFLNPGVPPTLF